MDRNQLDALTEVGKSFLRFVYFGLLGLIAAFLVSLGADADLATVTWTVAGFTVPVGVWIIAGAGYVAKAIDRFVRTNDNNDRNGIAPKFLQR